MLEKNQILAMKSELKSIKQANLAKRILSVCMDGVLCVFIFVFLMTLVFGKIADKAFDYDKKSVKFLSYQTNSHLVLVQETDGEEKKIVDPKDLKSTNFTTIVLYKYNTDDVEFYKDHLRYYYLNYKTGDVAANVPEGKDINDYRAPDYDKVMDNGLLPKDFYNTAWAAEHIDPISTVEDAKKLAVEAYSDFYHSSYITKLNNNLKGIQVFIVGTSYAVSFSIFFILFPLVFKNGETLGKKTFSLGLVTKDGYSVKKRQIVFRQLILLIYVTLFAFGYGFGLTSIATLGLGVAIYFVAVAISKSNRSLADYCAYTYLIDTRLSVWFETPEVEAQKEAELAEKMKRYPEEKPVSKNVIQVGTEIVDEQIKKEFLEEKEKAKNSKK